ncbi:MAG: polymorphic toxin-type HINT domain-containing protein [Capsulimonadales bacterium]|nr:polymorphic toxin-type HINT domain-containing protein [Capsulimonadales bacterium]
MNETSELVSVCLSDRSGRIVERIAATSEHPFFTSKGQVKAGDLGIGTEILTRAGPPLIVAGVEKISLDEPVPVFNFEVDDPADKGEGGSKHSYFVGHDSGGLWVHNGGCIDVNLPVPPNRRAYITYAIKNAGEVVYIGRATSKDKGATPMDAWRYRLKGGHDHFHPELGDEVEIIDVQESKATSQAAEWIWWQFYGGSRDPGTNLLRNVDPPFSDRLDLWRKNKPKIIRYLKEKR